jgi:hypothetical protein
MVMSYLGWWAGGKIEKLTFKAAGKITAKKVSEEIIDDFKTKIGKD